MANCIAHNLFNLVAAVALLCQTSRHRAIYDFKVATARKLFEFYQGKIRLNACSVTIHY